MNGKRKCNILKSLRQKIAKDNDIPFVSEECTHQGECRGTCPKCDEEVRYLEQELLKREAMPNAAASSDTTPPVEYYAPYDSTIPILFEETAGIPAWTDFPLMGDISPSDTDFDWSDL